MGHTTVCLTTNTDFSLGVFLTIKASSIYQTVNIDSINCLKNTGKLTRKLRIFDSML